MARRFRWRRAGYGPRGAGWLAWRRGLVGGNRFDANGVAVLPFTNLSGDPAQAYFADGLSAEVRAQWGQRETAMSVLARARTLGDSGLVYANTDPLLDPLRLLPACGELLRQLGFV